MQTFRSRTTLLVGSVLLAACAPDAWKPDKAYEQFLDQVQDACYYQPISSTTIGNLLQPSGSMNSSFFLDATSRLYAGRITPEAWTTMMTTQLQANAGDRGIRCLLDVYEKAKPRGGK